MRVIQMFARRLAASLTFAHRNKAETAVESAASAPKRKAAPQSFEANDPDDMEYRVIARHIADLMLADEWIEIADQIAEWERALDQTPGGLRFHEIATEVALSGLQSLIDSAPHAAFSDLEHAEYELSCFMETHLAAPDNHVLAVMAARAHLMMGETCRADHWPEELRTEAWRRMARSYVRASDILDSYDARARMSPLVAETKYLTAKGAPAGAHRIPELFEAWITLDPSNPRIYDTHAEWLANPDNASQQTILSLAEEALERTEDILGFGGYALFFRPLLALSDDARSFYNPEFYATGLLDLATLSASQADANRAADALAQEIDQCGSDAPAALRDTLLMLVRNEIKVFYPRLWTRPEDTIRGLIDEAANTIPDIAFDDLSKAA